MAPRAKTSDRGPIPARSPAICSGAMNEGVPRTPIRTVAVALGSSPARESGCWRCADAFFRIVFRRKIGEFVMQRFIADTQRIIFGIRDFRRVLLMIKRVVMPDLFGKRHHLRRRFDGRRFAGFKCSLGCLSGAHNPSLHYFAQFFDKLRAGDFNLGFCRKVFHQNGALGLLVRSQKDGERNPGFIGVFQLFFELCRFEVVLDIEPGAA